MKPGDLILVRGTSRLSLEIMKATGGRFSHVAIVVCSMAPMDPTDGIVIKALMPRVVTRPFHDSILGASYWEIWSNKTLADDQRWGIVAAACLYSAHDYGYGKIFEQGLDSAFRTILFTEKMPQIQGVPICSALGCLSYNEIGLELGPKDARSITPADIAEFVAASADYEAVATAETMEWGNVAGWAAAFIAFVAVNASTIQWLLKRRDEQHQRDSGRVDELEKQLTDLRVALPMEYVRREDWIRFSGTLDAKLDAMREEMREDIAEVKERLYAGRN